MNDNTMPVRPADMEHTIVYRREDEYAGWPFNGGLWNFGDGEILVGFNRNRYAYDKSGDISDAHKCNLLSDPLQGKCH